MAGHGLSYEEREILQGSINSPSERAAHKKVSAKLKAKGYKQSANGRIVRVKGKGGKLMRAMARAKGGKAAAGGGGG